MIDNREVGKTIATLRQSRNLTQQQLAAMLNVSHQAVSKWENGAALPDVQTLMELSRLFGVTMEQLLNGEVPQDRVEGEADDPIGNIGKFFNNIVNGIFQPAEQAEKETVDEKSADEAEEKEQLDIERLLQMAPFMSRSAVDAMLLEHRQQLTSGDIARFAPYISRECLEKLIVNPEKEITWETLQKIAPFLKREMVDKLARLAANGSRIVQENTEKQPCNPGEDIGRAINEFGRGVEQVVRKAAKLGENVVNEVTNAYNSFVEGAKTREDRVKALRRAACERALQDENWDWLREHIDEIEDVELLEAIAKRANEAGMQDWVQANMSGYADPNRIDDAIQAGEWDWLGEHVCQFEDEDQEKIALAAMKAEKWQWLSEYVELIFLDNCADQIALAANQAGEKELVIKLCNRCLNADGREALANAMVADEDYEALESIADDLPDEYFGRFCLARAQQGKWVDVWRFIERADAGSVEGMMELAISQGNFDAIDRVNQYL